MSDFRDRLTTRQLAGLTAREAVERWHNETHPFGFEQCTLQPCEAVAWSEEIDVVEEVEELAESLTEMSEQVSMILAELRKSQ